MTRIDLRTCHGVATTRPLVYLAAGLLLGLGISVLV